MNIKTFNFSIDKVIAKWYNKDKIKERTEKENIKMDNKKYYIYLTGWNGMQIEEVEKRKYEKVYNNFEEAKEEIKRLLEEEVECDEGIYLYHDGVLKEIEYFDIYK